VLLARAPSAGPSERVRDANHARRIRALLPLSPDCQSNQRARLAPEHRPRQPRRARRAGCRPRVDLGRPTNPSSRRLGGLPLEADIIRVLAGAPEPPPRPNSLQPACRRILENRSTRAVSPDGCQQDFAPLLYNLSP